MSAGEPASVIASYLLGGIPFGLLLVKVLKRVDLRQVGSGNIGTVNVSRVAGPKVALLVLALDAGKGAVLVFLGRWLWAGRADLGAVICGLTAILGHTFSPFLKFRGGRGVATSWGVVLALCWWAGLAALLIWGTMVALTRYASIGSMTAAVSLPVIFGLAKMPFPYVVFSILIALIVVTRHIPNIKRLLRGEELKLGQRVVEEEP